jgi:hypothetical protein
MMPYIQGDPLSVPQEIRDHYSKILEDVFVKRGDIGFLTIDESLVEQGKPHRGTRAKYGRALHTEAGQHPDKLYAWGGGGGWGSHHRTLLDGDVKVLLANNIDDSCAIWDEPRRSTSIDGDIGDLAEQYPLNKATLVKAGEVHEIGILTPHESLKVGKNTRRQFLRIVSSGVHGREPYFTINPLLSL